MPLPSLKLDRATCLDTATRAAAWLRAAALPQKRGIAWPGDPADRKSVSYGTFSGNAGVLLFLCELWHASPDPRVLKMIQGAGEYLLAVLDESGDGLPAGLYHGYAGIGTALLAAARASGDTDFEEGARRCVQRLRRTAVTAGEGIEWHLKVRPHGDPAADEVDFVPTDIIAGLAGVGLFLLYANQHLGEDSLEMALAVGRRLVMLADQRETGLDWASGVPGVPGVDYRMPNFSHGTAGVAYCLASISGATGDRTLLDAAVAGGRYLQSIAVIAGGICLVPADDRGTRLPLYELGWCHGPSGTGALWHRLYRETGDADWLSWFESSARALLPGAIPDSVPGVDRVEPPGTWPSVCWCHGSAGNADFLFNAWLATGNEAFRKGGDLMLEDCLRRAVPDADGLKWKQDGSFQTGLSVGAAGIGLAFVRRYLYLSERTPVVVLPDVATMLDGR